MIVRKIEEVRQDKVEMEGAKSAKIRWLISKDDGAPVFAMREFEIEPGGYTPYHSHDFEHEVFVLSGNGIVAGEEGEHKLEPGVVVFVPGGEKHNFKNNGDEVLRFLCLVPHVG